MSLLVNDLTKIPFSKFSEILKILNDISSDQKYVIVTKYYFITSFSSLKEYESEVIKNQKNILINGTISSVIKRFNDVKVGDVFYNM